VILVRDILAWVDGFAPFRYAAPWDQCGLQVGDPDAPVNRLLVALDPGSATLREAQELACQCLVTHHPLLFQALKAVRADHFPGNLVIAAVRGGIHLIAAHTNVDAARDGTNDVLGERLSVAQMEPLERDDTRVGEERYGGMGRVGLLPQPMAFEVLVAKTSEALGGIPVRAVGDARKQVSRVALCSGSGGSLMELAIKAGADVFITGDVKYHDAQRALEADLALIDVGHFASEQIVVRPLAAFLRAQAVGRREVLEVLEARVEKDPFWHRAGDAEGSSY
jgi:dinuclear metal center YbgI/SA1388 family protein